MQQQMPQFMPPPPQPGAAPGQSQVPVWQQQAEQGGPPEVRLRFLSFRVRLVPPTPHQAAVAKPAQRGPAGPALDVKSGLSLEVVTGKARL